jgi:hypothetical protein
MNTSPCGQRLPAVSTRVSRFGAGLDLLPKSSATPNLNGVAKSIATSKPEVAPKFGSFIIMHQMMMNNMRHRGGYYGSYPDPPPSKFRKALAGIMLLLSLGGLGFAIPGVVKAESQPMADASASISQSTHDTYKVGYEQGLQTEQFRQAYCMNLQDFSVQAANIENQHDLAQQIRALDLSKPDQKFCDGIVKEMAARGIEIHVNKGHYSLKGEGSEAYETEAAFNRFADEVLQPALAKRMASPERASEAVQVMKQEGARFIQDKEAFDTHEGNMFGLLVLAACASFGSLCWNGFEWSLE